MVPVLATYASVSQVDDLESISFVNCLIGRAPRRSHQASVAPAPTTRAGLHAVITERITHALKNSEIAVLDRLSDEARARLTGSICELAVSANLYGAQLEAFAEGLSCAVHCTMGPP